jgi:hypothetical protein
MPRTKHTYICAICGKEQPKDWLYKPDNDDHDAICEPCFDEHMEIRPVEGARLGNDAVGEYRVAEFYNKVTGKSILHPVRIVKQQ